MAKTKYLSPPLDHRTGRREFYPHQAAILTDPRPNILVSGGQGSGKSLIGLMWAILRTVEHPGEMGIVAGLTVKSLKRTIMRLLKKWDQWFVEVNGVSLIRKIHKTDLTVEWYNGSVWAYTTYDNPQVERGQSAAWCWMDETSSMEEVSNTDQTAFWDVIQGRLREVEYPRIMVTTTPKGNVGITGIFTEEILNGNGREYSIHIAGTALNKSLPPAYFKRFARFSKKYHDQEVKGFILGQGGGHFDGVLGPEAFVHYTISNGRPIYCGIDWGDANPTAVFVQEGYLRSGARVWVVCGEVQRAANNAALVNEIIRKLKQWGIRECFFCPDPENKYAIDDMKSILNKQRSWLTYSPGSHVLYPPAGMHKRVAYGLQLMHGAFCDHEDVRSLYLSSSLPTRLTDPAHQWPIALGLSQYKIVEGTGKAKGNDKWKHGVDALRYACLQIFRTRVADFLKALDPTSSRRWTGEQ